MADNAKIETQAIEAPAKAVKVVADVTETLAQASAKRITVVARAEIDFGVDDRICLESHFPLGGINLYCAQETFPADRWS